MYVYVDVSIVEESSGRHNVLNTWNYCQSKTAAFSSTGRIPVTPVSPQGADLVVWFMKPCGILADLQESPGGGGTVYWEAG